METSSCTIDTRNKIYVAVMPIITDARADHSRLTDDLVPYAPHFDGVCSSLAWSLSLLFDVNY